VLRDRPDEEDRDDEDREEEEEDRDDEDRTEDERPLPDRPLPEEVTERPEDRLDREGDEKVLREREGAELRGALERKDGEEPDREDRLGAVNRDDRAAPLEDLEPEIRLGAW
jgi:hypothetical protein